MSVLFPFFFSINLSAQVKAEASSTVDGRRIGLCFNFLTCFNDDYMTYLSVACFLDRGDESRTLRNRTKQTLPTTDIPTYRHIPTLIKHRISDSPRETSISHPGDSELAAQTEGELGVGRQMTKIDPGPEMISFDVIWNDNLISVPVAGCV